MSSNMAKRYEAAWNKLFYESADWKKRLIISDPFGYNAGELAHEAAKLAESQEKIPLTSGVNN